MTEIQYPSLKYVTMTLLLSVLVVGLLCLYICYKSIDFFEKI